MPDDNGALFQFNEFGGGSESGVLFLWQEGQVTKLLSDVPNQNWLPFSYLFPLVQSDHYLSFFEIDEENRDEFTFYLAGFARLSRPRLPDAKRQGGALLVAGRCKSDFGSGQ